LLWSAIPSRKAVNVGPQSLQRSSVFLSVNSSCLRLEILKKMKRGERGGEGGALWSLVYSAV
jgi:hypothetical protein